MYLSAERYIGDWNHSEIAERSQYSAILSAIGIPAFRCGESPSLRVDVTVCYWRKANAIHAWFVRECQDSKDECQRSYVDREKLGSLVDLCNILLQTKDPVQALKLLPPVSGFFFGSCNIDDWFWDDIKHTATQLQAVLDNPAFAGCDFYYRSSW